MIRLCLWVGLACVVSACAVRGPSTVVRDRFDYVEAIGRSREEQMLLNLVKIRYAESPMFLEVGQVVAGYNFEGTLGAEASDVGDATNSLGISANAKYVERPTITYSPILGRKFDELLLTPIPPGVVLFLVEAGWSPELVLRMTVDAVNGQRNRSGLSWRPYAGDEAFDNFVDTLADMQRAGSLGIRLEKDDEGQYSTMIFVHPHRLTPEMQERLTSLKEDIGLSPSEQSYDVAYGPPDDNPGRLNILTRSLLQILTEQSTCIDIPPEHVELALPEFEGGAHGNLPLVHIASGESPPPTAFTRVRYRDVWFWIDDRDLDSKIAFSFLILLFNIAEEGGKNLQPVITIPA